MLPRQGLPFAVIQHPIIEAILIANIVKGANVWKVQRTERTCFSVK